MMLRAGEAVVGNPGEAKRMVNPEPTPWTARSVNCTVPATASTEAVPCSPFGTETLPWKSAAVKRTPEPCWKTRPVPATSRRRRGCVVSVSPETAASGTERKAAHPAS